jgi:hypothetical protein
MYAVINVAQAHNKIIPVGLLFNVGDEALWINATWNQTVGNLSLPVNVNPLCASFLLPAEGTREITVVFDDLDQAWVQHRITFLGEYYGVIEIVGSRINWTGGGSQNVPTGSFPLNVSIVKDLVPARLDLTNLNLSKTTVDPQETLVATVQAHNVGEQVGNFSFHLKLDGTVLQTQNKTLNASEAVQLTFTFSVADSGQHNVVVDGVSESGAKTGLGRELDVTGSTNYSLFGIIGGVGVLVCVGGGFAVWRATKSPREKGEEVET